MLEVRNLSKSFGGLKAVQDVSLDVKRGEIVGLIGPNGAGKTTVFNCITGFLRPDGGQVRLNGEEVAGLPPNEIARRGMVRTFQTPVGFPRLTVWENLAVVPFGQRGEHLWPALFPSRAVLDQERAHVRKAMELLERFGLRERRDELVVNLSAPELKLLELARQLMLEPQILLLDEPAAGVNPAMLGELVDLLERLRARGFTFLIVDHNLGFIMKITDRVYVMAAGEVIAHGPPDEVSRNERVQQVYLGAGA